MFSFAVTAEKVNGADLHSLMGKTGDFDCASNIRLGYNITINPGQDMINEIATEDQLSQLKRWCMCYHDLQMALSSLTFFNEEFDFDQKKYNYIELRRLKCFELSFVVSYSRAFTVSEGSRYNRFFKKR